MTRNAVSKKERVYEVIRQFSDGDFRLLTTWRFMVNYYNPSLNDFDEKNRNIVSSNKELATLFLILKRKGVLVEQKNYSTGDMTTSFYRFVKK